MKKNRILVILLCIFILGIGAITAYAMDNSLGTNVKDEQDKGAIVESDQDKGAIVEDNQDKGTIADDHDEGTLSEADREKKLQELRKKGESLVGSFVYQEKVLLGEADPYMKRMDLQEVQQIIANGDSFDDILASFRERQRYPDFVGGSGVTIIEYWFDSSGDEKILIIVQQSEIYHDYMEGETISAELLYH